MPRGFGRLPFLGRRSASADASSTDDRAPVRPPIDPELAPLGPPVLLPRTIVRQLLFDATELVPAWAVRRPEPAALMTAEPPATKPARRARATRASTTSADAKPAAKARSRSRKSSPD